MQNVYIIVWMIITFGLGTVCTYISLQRIDFSKLFKPNSSTQIRLLLIFISLSVGCSLASFFGYLMSLLYKI